MGKTLEIFLLVFTMLAGTIGVIFFDTLIFKLIFILILFIILIITYSIIDIVRKAKEEKIFQEKMQNAGIFEVDMMKGVEFEYFLKELYSSLGFNVQMTNSTNDFGADLILVNENMKVVLQAKRYSKNVGVRAVQEVVAAQMHYKATQAWVVTNSHFTKQAKELASSNGVTLINRDQLIHTILLAKQQDKYVVK